MAIELVIFDLAGTTVDDGDAVNRCLRDALAAAGVTVTRDAVNGVMGIPKPVAIGVLLGGDAPADRIAAIFDDFAVRMTRFYAEDPAVAEVAGTSETFAALRAAGIKVAVNTGFDRAVTRTLLDRLGWERGGLIDASLCSDEVPRGRPHPDMIRRLMADLGVGDPRSVAKVGDTPADLQEGTAAGCGRVVGVLNGTHTRPQLEGFPHTDLIASVADLPGALGLDPASDRPAG
ncbi:phosphonatase-like hydrolase [Aquisphaera insulae]|uniref:phosphonatase-like hydrolase n=1 Tax=Aquisphaera insulae TaxID=2712864 RepID=UPI0013EE149A|nr:phosphonatase-like hydrolase [Aquisphaera insulae]